MLIAWADYDGTEGNALTAAHGISLVTPVRKRIPELGAMRASVLGARRDRRALWLAPAAAGALVIRDAAHRDGVTPPVLARTLAEWTFDAGAVSGALRLGRPDLLLAGFAAAHPGEAPPDPGEAPADPGEAPADPAEALAGSGDGVPEHAA